MRYKGAYYPATMKLANLQIQIDLGCDPEVLRFFPEEMIEKDQPDLDLAIWEADEEWWKGRASKTWLAQQTKVRETNPRLH